MPFYMTGTTRCISYRNAASSVERLEQPAVIRRDGRFYVVTRLCERPVQPGQFEFKINEGETVYNWEPAP